MAEPNGHVFLGIITTYRYYLATILFVLLKAAGLVQVFHFVLVLFAHFTEYIDFPCCRT